MYLISFPHVFLMYINPKNATKRHILKYSRLLCTNGFKFTTVDLFILHYWMCFRDGVWLLPAGNNGECQDLSVHVCLNAKATGRTDWALFEMFVWNRQQDFTPTQSITAAHIPWASDCISYSQSQPSHVCDSPPQSCRTVSKPILW